MSGILYNLSNRKEEVMVILTPERHRIILDTLKEKQVVKIQELVELTNTSESTIRRDLVQLEEANYLKRVHGGASLLQGKRTEPSISEKSTKNLQEKQLIGQYASQLVEEGDSIFLDAGTTTMQMIPYLNKKDITVVTNGITLVEPLLEMGIQTYLLGGMIKGKTRALIGRAALETLKSYRFDKCFIGVNSIHHIHGLSTPDPEEALVKQTALHLSRECYALADQTKFGEVSFAKITDIELAIIVTTINGDDEMLEPYFKRTKVKVVTP